MRCEHFFCNSDKIIIFLSDVTAKLIFLRKYNFMFATTRNNKQPQATTSNYTQQKALTRNITQQQAAANSGLPEYGVANFRLG